MILIIMIRNLYNDGGTMEIKQLQTFYTVSQELNFTKAAEKLGYTQACVSLHIQSLEHELNQLLFNRIGKIITLTESGKQLVPYAAQMLELEKQIRKIGEDELECSLIRIGICDSLCVNRMPRIIERYKTYRPKVEIQLEILKCSQFYTALANDEIDLAFTIGYLDKEAGICYTCEKEEPIYVLSSPSNALARKEKIVIEDFRDIPIIFTERAAYYRRNFEHELNQQGIQPKIVLETESIQAIKKLTQSGLGVCILPYTAVEEEIEQKQLVPLAYDCNYGIRSHIIWHKDKKLSKVQQEFIDMAVDYIKIQEEKGM